MRRRPLIVVPLASSFAAAAPKALAATFDDDPPRGVAPRRLVFPADFGAHPQTRIEWWYLTGALATDAGGGPPNFGFQLTFFRSRTAIAADHPSRFAARQLLFAHAALSDIRERRLRHDQRAARAGFGIAEATRGDTATWIGDWRLERRAAAEASRYAARLTSSSAGFALALQLAATREPLLQGDGGYSRKGPQPQQASHYYSEPQLEASGTLTLDGRTLSVAGRAWLDHEWSDSLLAADAVGWDWVGFNLRDGSALTAFQLRRADGSALYAGGSFRPPTGATRNFAADEVVFDAGRRWASGHTRAVYPVQWSLRTPAGRFTVDALFDDQELDSRRSTGAVYWEGISRLLDGDGRLLGYGYLEMTGYVVRLRI